MEIKLYEKNPFDFRLIENLFVDTFKRDFNPEYWNWRFSENPIENGPNIAYIEEKGKLIGFYAVSQTIFNDEGNIITCGLMNAAMIHPDYEGNGLFAKMEVELHNYLLNEKGFSFLYGFANHNAHRIHRKHAGWKDIFMLNLFYSNSSYMRLKLKEIDDYNYSVFESITYNFEKLDEIIGRSVTYGFTRSSLMLDWRLKDPRNKYMVFEVKDNLNSFLGILIYKQYAQNIDLMDYYYHSEKISKWSFLKLGLHYLSQISDGIYTWSNLFSSDHIFLESLGFQEKEFNTYFGYISNNFDLDHEKLHFSFLDSDVY